MFNIERTKRGFPALWEEGGGYTNTGWARIIAQPDGSRPKAIYIRRSGTLANSEHALVVIDKGWFVVEASHHRGDFNISIYRITAINGDEASAELIYEFSRGEWGPDEPKMLLAAIEAAKEKALCYHCRGPHFIQDDE